MGMVLMGPCMTLRKSRCTRSYGKVVFPTVIFQIYTICSNMGWTVISRKDVSRKSLTFRQAERWEAESITLAPTTIAHFAS